MGLGLILGLGLGLGWDRMGISSVNGAWARVEGRVLG